MLTATYYYVDSNKVLCCWDQNVLLDMKMKELGAVFIEIHQDHADIHNHTLTIAKLHLEVCEQPDPPS